VTTFETERVYCWFVVAAAAAEVDGAAVATQSPTTAVDCSQRTMFI